MTKNVSSRLRVCGIVFIEVIFFGCRQVSAPETIAEIQASHTKGNVPAQSEFNRLLKRDLTAYFVSKRGKDIEVECEFLREGPTQTGISFPKYYLWVKIMKENKLIEQGAVRVAVVEKQSFDVTDYLSESVLKKDIESANDIFPSEVIEKIKDHLK